jgi:transcriptional regulator with XRE-family HTH domain
MLKRPRETEAQQFSRRLRHALKEAGYKQSPTVLANEFNLRYWGDGITAHAARNWMNGTSLPKPDKLRILADWLRISPQDLLFGPDADPSVLALREANPRYPISLADDTMVRKYQHLPQEQRRVVREVVAGLFALEQQRTAQIPEHSEDSSTGKTSRQTSDSHQ